MTKQEEILKTLQGHIKDSNERHDEIEKAMYTLGERQKLINIAVIGEEEIDAPGLLSRMKIVENDVEKVKKFNFKVTALITMIASGLTWVGVKIGSFFTGTN